MTNAIPPGSTPFSTDNLRLAASLAALGYAFEARPAVLASGGQKGICYFRFAAIPELLNAAALYYDGRLPVDVSAYESAKRRIFAATAEATGRSAK